MWEPPDPGDIVWCRFPQWPRDPKPRPALALSVIEHGDGVAVAVAYGTSGTSQRTDRRLSGEFAIRKAEHKAAYATAGLSYDTKFDLRHVVELPWNAKFFAVPPAPQHGQTPKLGSLHIGMTAALAAAVRAVQR